MSSVVVSDAYWRWVIVLWSSLGNPVLSSCLTEEL